MERGAQRREAVCINAADLTEDAKLTCTLTGTSPDYGTVYVDENMNLIHAPAEADAEDTLHLENGILSVETPVNEYELNENVLSIVRNRLNGSVTAEAWVYTAVPEKLVEFKYDSNGLRTQKKVTDHGQMVVTDYIYHGKQLAGLTCGNDTLHFFYDAQGRPAKVDCNGTLYTYVHSLQGDVAGLLDGTGALVVEYVYSAWGNMQVTIGILATTLGRQNPFRYRGYIYDEELNVYYLKNRYFEPTKKRFLNADALIQIGIVLSHSFTYCSNNPIRRIDKTGFSWHDVIVEFFNNIQNDVMQQAELRADVDSRFIHTVDDGLSGQYGYLKEKVLNVTNFIKNWWNTEAVPWFQDLRETNQEFIELKNQMNYTAYSKVETWFSNMDWQRIGKETTKEALKGAAGGYAAGALSAALGAPFTAGLSVAGSGLAGAAVGFVSGAVEGFVGTFIDEAWQ